LNVALWPLGLYFFAVLALVVMMIGLSQLLGERHKERTTGEPYESGIVPTGSARIRFDANFYLIAVFFVIFDLETLFIISWAIAVRELGWTGYIEIVIFIGILFVALIYLWGVGGLDLGAKNKPGATNRLSQRTRL
jgi:NADH-quinone oxidoreductase subunit A